MKNHRMPHKVLYFSVIFSKPIYLEPEEEEESKGEPQPKSTEKIEHDIIQKNPSPVKAPPGKTFLI